MNLLVEQVLIKENSATLQGLKDMLYEVRCLKSNEDMILDFPNAPTSNDKGFNSGVTLHRKNRSHSFVSCTFALLSHLSFTIKINVF